MRRRDALRWIGTSSGLVVLSSCGGGSGGDDDGVAIDAADDTDALVLPDGGICRATTDDVLGPFHRDGAPSRMMIASANEAGDRIALGGIVVAGTDCATPLTGAALDIWQADATGAYHEPSAGEAFRLRGKVAAAADGTWAIDTIKPGNYRNGPGWRPAHIHFIVSHPGYRTLTTQLYFAGDQFLPPNDSCTSCGSDDPARIIPLVARSGGGFTGEFRIVLARA